MHIMHVIDSLTTGGAERMAVELANHTLQDGYRVSVCVTRSCADLRAELSTEIPFWVLNRRRRFDWGTMFRFGKLITQGRVDVLHAHGLSTFSLLAFMKTIGLVKAPIIFHDHGGGIEYENSIPPWFRFWARHQLAHFVGVYSKLAKRAEQSGVPPERISVIENAIDLMRLAQASALNLRQEFQIEESKLVGVVVSNFLYAKGIDILIRSLAKTNLRDRLTILIVGKENDAEYAGKCKALISSLGLSRQLLPVGQRLDVGSILKGADFGVLSSRSESGPIVLIEYMAAGLPFVSTLVGSIAQRVSQLGVPEFVLPGDMDAMAEGLDRLLSLSTQERVQRGKAGQDIAFCEFDIRRVMPRWYELYRDVAERK